MKSKITNIIIWGVLSIVLMVILGFANNTHNEVNCRGLEILINYEDGDYFITEEELRNSIVSEFDHLENSKLSDINLNSIEAIIENNDFVERADAYKTLDAFVKVKVKQRKPLFRMIDRNMKGYYIDNKGRTMPLNKNFSSRVLIVNGSIDIPNNTNIKDTSNHIDTLKYRLYYDVIKLADFVTKDKFWNAMIEQIYISGNGDIELVPKLGNHVVIFGDITEMKSKFDKLMLFYKHGIDENGWKNYSVINLKFRNQIICK